MDRVNFVRIAQVRIPKFCKICSFGDPAA